MKIHLVKSKEVDIALFTNVVTLLQAIPGPLEFLYKKNAVLNFDEDEFYSNTIHNKKQFEKMEEPVYSMEVSYNHIELPLTRNTTTWKTFFKKCEQYRKENKIANNEFVLLMTDIANDMNWFAVLDEKLPYNGFIHTDDWEYYINCSAAFPIAYEVIALVLQKHMFEGVLELRKNVHNTPIGCVNDMCIQKREIILKLRTADICPDCMARVSGKITIPELHHALHIMGSLREKMLFAQNFRQTSPLSRLRVDHKKRIYLTDFGNMEIKLRPLEKALFFLFLKNEEGILNSSLYEYRNELYEIYALISNMGDLYEMRERINELTNALSESASQKMSRIKRVFEEAIGNELAKNYYIHGEVGHAKKIILDRQLVSFE